MAITIKFVQLLMREFSQFIGRVSNIFCSHIDFLAEYRTDDGEHSISVEWYYNQIAHQ